MPGLRRSDRAIIASLPIGYEAKHIQEVFPKELFPLNNKGCPHYGDSPWVLFIDGERHIPLIEILMQIYQDGNDGKQGNRIRGIQARKAKAKNFCGDFTNLAMLCSYLLKMGVLQAMPKAVLDQQVQAVPVTESELKPKRTTNTGSHLIKLENAPNQVLTNWCSQALSYWGDKKTALKAIESVFDAIAEAEKVIQERKVSTLKTIADTFPGMDTSTLEKALEAERKKQILTLTENLPLPPSAKNENDSHS